jgi:AraC-like DNA-binding protein
MRYLEHPVPDSLRAIVHAVWTLESDRADAPPASPEAVIPDGRSEIVVHFGDAFERWDADGVARQPEILIAGQLGGPLRLRPTGRIGRLGVRLTAAGAPALVDVPQYELAGRTVAASEVSDPLAAWLHQVRDAARTPVAAAGIVCAGLARLVRPDAVDARGARAAGLIARWPAPRGVDAIAASVGLTRRQLERLFLRHVGLAPKSLMRIHRVQRALAVLDGRAGAGSPRPGTDTAFACGYADQAHFVREFRALAGSTPGEHLVRRAGLTGVFVGAS